LRLKRREQAADSRFGRERVDELKDETLLDELKDKAAELLELKDKAAEEAKALKEQLAAVEAEWQRRLQEASGEKERAAEEAKALQEQLSLKDTAARHARALQENVFEEAKALRERIALKDSVAEEAGERERQARCLKLLVHEA